MNEGLRPQRLTQYISLFISRQHRRLQLCQHQHELDILQDKRMVWASSRWILVFIYRLRRNLGVNHDGKEGTSISIVETLCAHYERGYLINGGRIENGVRNPIRSAILSECGDHIARETIHSSMQSEAIIFTSSRAIYSADSS